MEDNRALYMIQLGIQRATMRPKAVTPGVVGVCGRGSRSLTALGVSGGANGSWHGTARRCSLGT
eukprot:3507698-Prymnesium_polylepis.1